MLPVPLGPAIAALIAAALYARGVRLMDRDWPLWRSALFFLGLAVFVVALSSPVDALAHELFSVHMVQHMMLTVVASPLILLGAPIRPLLRGLPGVLRAGIVRPLAGSAVIRGAGHALRWPLIAAGLYVGGLYAWHIPTIYDAAVNDAVLHNLQHVWFLSTALLFWSVVIDPVPFGSRLSYAPRILFLLLAGAAQNTVLGGLLAFSSRLFYTTYESSPLAFGLDPVSDQRLGGAIMWVPGDVIFLLAASISFFMFLNAEDREQLARERTALAARRQPPGVQ